MPTPFHSYKLSQERVLRRGQQELSPESSPQPSSTTCLLGPGLPGPRASPALDKGVGLGGG